MKKKIKLRCNGPEHHVNEIDVEKALEKTLVIKSAEFARRLDETVFPLYLTCRYCDGQVIIERADVEE